MALREKLFPVPFSYYILAVSSIPCRTDTRLQSGSRLPIAFSLCVCLSSHWDTSHPGFRVLANIIRCHLTLITSAKILFPNEGMFTGTGDHNFNLPLGSVRCNP